MRAVRLCAATAALALAGAALAQEVGQPAPAWKVSAAKGIKKTTKVADFKGKWLVVEFWGFW